MNRSIFRLACVGLMAAAFVVVAMIERDVAAADAGAELLPREPAAWINSPPLTAEMLKGKGVFLWFYEEQCPTCRGKWPALFELAKKYEGEPVVFVAVNSGSPRPAVEQYAKGVGLAWPVIVDPSRTFEKRFIEAEISLQNIHQVGLILPSGQKQMGQWNDLEGAVKQALAGAAWKVDPKGIPPAFQPTWRLVEVGKYSAAAPMLKKGLTTSNAEVKEAAKRVQAFVEHEMQTAIDQAGKFRQDGDPWRAYQSYLAIVATFAGYDLPSDVASAPKELVSDEKVKQQLEAAKALDAVKKTFASARSESGKKRIVTRLEQIIEQYRDTDAASEARQILAQAGQASEG